MATQTLKEYAAAKIKHFKGYADSANFKQSKLFFDVDRYLSRNRGYSRDQMPQIDFNEFMGIVEAMSTYTTVSSGRTSPMSLHATQNEINLEKVLKNIANGSVIQPDYVYIVDKDWFILDGHHTHVQTLIQDKNSQVLYIRFDDMSVDELIYMFTAVIDSEQKDIDDNIVEELFEAVNEGFYTKSYLTKLARDNKDFIKDEIERYRKLREESYGAQGPAAMPGMGAVEMSAVATSTGDAMNPDNRGSGDFLGTQKKKKKTYEEKLAESKARRDPDNIEAPVYAMNRASGEVFRFQGLKDLLKMPLDETHPLADIMDMKL